LAVSRNGKLAMAGDGQVSLGDTVMKRSARKVRRMYKDRFVAGFAGSTADALALFEKFEQKLDEYHGNLSRSAVELAKDWRTDRALRRLEALLIVAGDSRLFLLSGTGDVIEPDDGVLAVGSGGSLALVAARALLSHTQLSAREIATEALRLASEVDVYTNDNIIVEEV
jgi:ATP-dependent HslUV protease subunit HslV